MSVTTTAYPLVGVTTRLSPPRPGIYYTSVAIYNPVLAAFGVTLGGDQNTLSPQSAQLFMMASSGSTPLLTSLPSSLPYGSFLGPITCVWFDPDDTAGSFPVTLGTIGGLVLWTPPIPYPESGDFFVASGVTPKAIVIANLSAPGCNVEVFGVQSGDSYGPISISGGSSATLQIPSTDTTDTAFQIGVTGGGTNTLQISFQF